MGFDVYSSRDRKDLERGVPDFYFKYNIKPGPLRLEQAEYIRFCVRNQKIQFDGKIQVNPMAFDYLMIGGFMEDTVMLLREVTKQAEESRKVLEDLSNQVAVIYDVLKPILLKQLSDLRNQRIGMVSEYRDILNAGKDLRNFFLESDYKEEIERLERFVSLCREIKSLKADGTFDAICDSAIRLAIGEGKGGKNEKSQDEGKSI